MALLRGGGGDEPPLLTSAAGSTNFTTEHDSRVRCRCVLIRLLSLKLI